MLLSSIFQHPPHTENTIAFIQDLESSGIASKILTQTNDSTAYSLATIGWNTRCAFSPAAFVKASSVEDVSRAVQIAAKHGIAVQARSGGHSFGGYGLGGQNGALVVDLSDLNEVSYDPETQLATIGGGALLGRITEELDKHSVTFPHGTCAQVGIGGHATIGGQGILSRLYGLTLDNLRSVTAVLADGSVVHASATEYEDLFCGVRGAGASLCIITSFVVITHPMPTEVTHFFFDYSVGSPEELTKVFLKWQDYIASPEVKDDRLLNSLMTIKKGSILIQGSRIGPLAEYEKSSIHLNLGMDDDAKTYDIEVADWIASAQRWTTEAVNHYGSNLPIPQYMKSAFVQEPLSEQAVLAWFKYVDEHTPSGSSTFFLLDMEGGAIADVPNNATAYAHRNALYNICGYGIHPLLPFPDTVISFLTGCIDTIRTAMGRSKPYGVYPGYVDPLLPADEWAEAYWGDNYRRLREVKTKYDPNDVFRNPQSVQPLPI